MKPHTAARLALALLVLGLRAPFSAGEEPGGLSATDDARIRRVVATYAAAWRANDEPAALALIARNAVLVPHHGLEPVSGENALRAFWSPKDAPGATVARLAQHIDEVGGACGLAYASARLTVGWTSGKGADAKTWATTGTLLTLLRKQGDGSWLITRLMWDDTPAPSR